MAVCSTPWGEAAYIFVDPIFNMSANDDAGSKQIDAIFKAVKVRRSPRLHAGSEGSKNETKRRKKMMQLATTPFPSPPKPLLLQVAVWLTQPYWKNYHLSWIKLMTIMMAHLTCRKKKSTRRRRWQRRRVMAHLTTRRRRWQRRSPPTIATRLTRTDPQAQVRKLPRLLMSPVPPPPQLQHLRATKTKRSTANGIAYAVMTPK